MVGTEANFVDTQGVSLVNTTDGLTYTQVTDSNLDIHKLVEKHDLTDDTVDNVFSLYRNFIEAIMVVTTPELAALITLTVPTSGELPTKIWTLAYTNYSGSNADISITGQVQTLRIIDEGIGTVKLFIRIEGEETLSVA